MKNDFQPRELIAAVTEALRQGETLLAALTDDAYMQKLPQAFHASIGGHYRHCLDHFQLLLSAVAAGDLNYDLRDRGTLVETDRDAALKCTRELIAGWSKVELNFLDRPLRVTCKTSYATGGSQTSPSSVGREVMYAVAHAVHHYALIAFMARMMELPLPNGFGVAPSTMKYQHEMLKANQAPA